jgi:hypothetical protein
MPVDLTKFDGMTPGPYRISRHSKTAVVGASERLIASTSGHSTNMDNGEHHIENEANAAAIAAVPDLVAEVRELRAARDENERLRAALKTMRASHQRHMSNRELASIATVLGEEWLPMDDTGRTKKEEGAQQ